MLLIRSATAADAKALGRIRHLSWMETYVGLMDPGYLQTQTEEKSVKIFETMGCQNTLVAESEGSIIGFVSFGSSREDDLKESGEIIALYLLKSHHRKRIGHRLLEFALRALPDCPSYFLWVLDTNRKAIQFYLREGFVADGTTKTQRAGEGFLRELRMVKTPLPPAKRRR